MADRIVGLPGKRIAVEFWDLDEEQGDPVTGTLFGVFRSPTPAEHQQCRDLWDAVAGKDNPEEDAIDGLKLALRSLMCGAYIENGAGKIKVDNWEEGADASRVFDEPATFMRRLVFRPVAKDTERFLAEVARLRARSEGDSGGSEG